MEENKKIKRKATNGIEEDDVDEEDEEDDEIDRHMKQLGIMDNDERKGFDDDDEYDF